MSLTASGYTPYNFMGYDLVAELYNRDINSFLINDAVYGILTMNYSNLSDNYSITKQKLIDYILKNKLEYKQGNDEIVGWTLYGDKINADITGMVISALSTEYNRSSDVKAIVNSAVNSLSKLQNESGYIGDDFGHSSETLDFVILGLTSIGIDPEAAQFSKSKGDLVSALLSFKGTDGQFKHDLEGSDDYIATEEALRALISLKEYKGKGIYNYYSSAIDSTKLPQFTLSEKEMANLGILPQTGYFVDNSILIITGILILAAGVLVLGKKKLTRER
jgi:LPXTG-motif cell wall-anchored protein